MFRGRRGAAADKWGGGAARAKAGPQPDLEHFPTFTHYDRDLLGLLIDDTRAFLQLAALFLERRADDLQVLS